MDEEKLTNIPPEEAKKILLFLEGLLEIPQKSKYATTVCIKLLSYVEKNYPIHEKEWAERLYVLMTRPVPSIPQLLINSTPHLLINSIKTWLEECCQLQEKDTSENIYRIIKREYYHK